VKLSSTFFAACGLFLAACGSTPSAANGGNTFLIIISSLSYIPQNLTVPPGATIVVLNEDPIPHSVTSEAAAGAFTPGPVAGVSFDTSVPSNAQTTFEIPSTAPDGTVIPFFCTVHKGVMATPNGSITVRAPQ
jgi:plastocyanin